MSGTTTTSNSAPWTKQQPYLTTGWAAAQNLLKNNTPTYYPGSTVAQLSPYSQPAMTAAWNLGNDGTAAGAAIDKTGQSLLSNGANGFAGADVRQAIASGQFFNNRPQSGGAMGQAGADVLNATAQGQYTGQQNPYFQSAVTNAINVARPSIQGQFAGAGRTGSGAEAHALADSGTNIAANLGYQDYARERGLQQQAATTLGQMDLQAFGLDSTNHNFGLGQMGQMAQGQGQLDLAARGLGGQLAQMANNDAFQRVGLLGHVADRGDRRNQQQVDADVAKWNFNQNAPWDANARYMQMVGGNGYGTTTTSNATQNTSTFQDIMTGLGAVNAGLQTYGRYFG